MILPPGPFPLIAADPPWAFKTRSVKGAGRSPEAHYPTMSFDEIAALPVADVAARDCALLLWVAGFALPSGLALIERWGFTYKAIGFTWAKRSSSDRAWHLGLGYYSRANAEICLLATRGSPKRSAADVPSLIVAPRRAHSQKPEEFYARAERLFPGPYLDLFARQERPGWTTWGNETEKFPPLGSG